MISSLRWKLSRHLQRGLSSAVALVRISACAEEVLGDMQMVTIGRLTELRALVWRLESVNRDVCALFYEPFDSFEAPSTGCAREKSELFL